MLPLSYRIEQFIGQAIGRKKGVAFSFYRFLVSPLSLCIKMISGLRNWLYDHDWIKTERVSVPVISIGNIFVGGTGKTPVTLKLARELAAYLHLGIVLRGYRSEAEKKCEALVVDGRQSVKMVGDEAFLLAQNLPQATVCVSPKRVRGAQLAIQEGAECLLLDDGFQHRQLFRDFDIVVLRAEAIGRAVHFLPKGILRDSWSSLKRANLLVVTHHSAPREWQETFLRQWTSAPIVHMAPKVIGVYRGEESIPLSSFENKKVGIFCGIANPDRFYHTVSDLGTVIVHHLYLPDHMTIEPSPFFNFVHSCQKEGAELILCTEKDYVKLSSSQESPLPVFWVKIDLEIQSGERDWKSLIEAVMSLNSNRREDNGKRGRNSAT